MFEFGVHVYAFFWGWWYQAGVDGYRGERLCNKRCFQITYIMLLM